jgi:hypothetical protein
MIGKEGIVHRAIHKTSIIVCLLAIMPFQAWGAGLRAGAAKSVITPDWKAGKVYMAGFDYNRVATGVHDDLYVRCLALSTGKDTVAMCAADLIGLFYDNVLKVRERVKQLAPEVTHVIVASTHDHEGPDTMGLWGPAPLQSGIDEKYLDSVDEQIAQTAARAVHSMTDAQLTLARDTHPLLVLLQNDDRPPYVKDPYLFTMQLTAAAGGKTIATLVNWSDHPETLDSKNTEITADYPFWLCKRVEEKAGGVAVFFNGSIGGLLSTLGDQIALQDPETGEVAKDATWKKAELFGTLVGDLALRSLESGTKFDIDSIVIRKSVIFSPLQNDLFRIAAAAGAFKDRRPLYTDGKPDRSIALKDAPSPLKELSGQAQLPQAAGKDLQTEVDYLQLLSKGQTAAEIATVPGEIYPELVNGGITRYPGADFPDAPFEPTVRTHMKSKYQFIFGLGNDELGYIIPKAEWDNEPPWLKGKPERWYGEVNSCGPEMAGAVTRALVDLMEQK